MGSKWGARLCSSYWGKHGELLMDAMSDLRAWAGELIKIKLQAKLYPGVRACVAGVYREGGPRALFQVRELRPQARG